MTVSSASGGSGAAGAGARGSTPVAPPPPPATGGIGSATAMRVFAAIRCSLCQYLEFPGCDVHGVLYTERVTLSGAAAAATAVDGAAPPTHAKCPSCAAATHNVRPFRDGCRRCKAPTTVHMWTSSARELSRAHAAFPAAAGDEIAHSALLCDACGSVVFPRARDELTTRTARDPIVAPGGRALQVANFQLSMPHVDGCPRRGMPLRVVSVRLPRSELQFVRDRIEQCPLTPGVDGAPQYRPRGAAVVRQLNHLDQVMLRLLTTVISAFDPLSAAAVQPLQQIVGLLGQLEPLSLFSDWAPPRRLSQAIATPTRITASSELDKQHNCMRILENSSGCWLSAPPPTGSAVHNEWLVFEFAAPVVISIVTLRWRTDNTPSHFSVAVSSDGTAYDTVAIITERSAASRIAIPKGDAIKTIKITLSASAASNGTFGLESALFREAIEDSMHTAAPVLIEKLQRWLLDASASESMMARDLALQAAQKLALASGSLCSLLNLAAVLILHTSPEADADASAARYDEQTWNRADVLSEAAQHFSRQFLLELTISIRGVMTEVKVETVDEILTRVKQEALARGLSNSGASDNDARSQAAPSINNSRSAAEMPPPLPLTMTDVDKVRHSISANPTTLDTEEGGSRRLISQLLAQSHVIASVKRRSQIGVLILYILGELAVWEMQRMQKTEDLLAGSGKRAEELTTLEAPFSMEIRHEFFDISHRLLQSVLARWLTLPSSSANDVLKPEMDDDAIIANTTTSANHSRPDNKSTTTSKLDACLYDSLAHSLADLSGVVGLEAMPMTPTSAGLVGPSIKAALFSPDNVCVALLQVVTANIRRLVLSRVDPWDIEDSGAGTSRDASLKVDGDLLAAPPALQPMVSSLERLIGLGSKRSDKFFPISLKAAAAVEVGLEAFYPSALQRTKLLTSRMGKGATLEVQVRWPVQERDQEDPRYERLMLMLQFECIRMGWQHAVRGSWRFFMHLVVQVPVGTDSELALTQHFAPCIHKAGFAGWQVTAGAQEMAINLQRHLHWNRVEKMCQEAGVGWIRVYPRDVAEFGDVLADVEGFLVEQTPPETAPVHAP